MKDPRFISVDELRAAGALDVPPAWRKSLSAGTRQERDLFSELDADESTNAAADDETEGDKGSEVG